MLKKLLEGLRSLRRGDSDPDWEFDERRELVRVRCHYEVQGNLNSKTFPGQVVDMSLGGLKLRCFQNMTVGQNVDLTYSADALDAREQTITCRVQWVRTRESDLVRFIGLSYDASDDILRNSWVKIVLKQLGFRPDKVFQRRKFVRADCVIPAKLVYNRQQSTEGRLHNLGARGGLVECCTQLKHNEPVELQVGPFEKLATLHLTGKVVQVTPQDDVFLIGVQFGSLTDKSTDRLGQYLRHLLLEHWAE